MRERIGAWSSKLGVCGKREQMGGWGDQRVGSLLVLVGVRVWIWYIHIYMGERETERERHDLRK